jgi:hypothetical protein
MIMLFNTISMHAIQIYTLRMLCSRLAHIRAQPAEFAAQITLQNVPQRVCAPPILIALHSHCSTLTIHVHVPFNNNLSRQQAVEKAGNRAVPQDIAALAGVDITTARTGLQNLAALTGGDLEVSETGHIVYAFPSNFRLVLRSKSSAVAVRESFENVRVL